MRSLIAGFFVVLALVVSGVATVTVSAQEVPVLGENGWILPENDEPTFGAGPASEIASAPAVAAAPATQAGGGYYGIVAEAAAYYGLSPDYLWGVVGCETGYTYNLGLTGPNGEYGPFQFMESTFYWLAGLSGHGGSWTNAYDQAWVAAWAFANGYGSHWVCA